MSEGFQPNRCTLTPGALDHLDGQQLVEPSWFPELQLWGSQRRNEGSEESGYEGRGFKNAWRLQYKIFLLVIVSGLDVSSSAVQATKLDQLVAVLVVEDAPKLRRNFLAVLSPIVEVGKTETFERMSWRKNIWTRYLPLHPNHIQAPTVYYEWKPEVIHSDEPKLCMVPQMWWGLYVTYSALTRLRGNIASGKV